jgi:hypothetical protein
MDAKCESGRKPVRESGRVARQIQGGPLSRLLPIAHKYPPIPPQEQLLDIEASMATAFYFNSCVPRGTNLDSVPKSPEARSPIAFSPIPPTSPTSPSSTNNPFDNVVACPDECRNCLDDLLAELVQDEQTQAAVREVQAIIALAEAEAIWAKNARAYAEARAIEDAEYDAYYKARSVARAAADAAEGREALKKGKVYHLTREEIAAIDKMFLSVEPAPASFSQ